MTKNKVTTVWTKDMQFETDNPSGHSIFLEGSTQQGNSEGLSPKALMLSSLAGCTGLDVVSLLSKMRAEVDAFKIEVIGQLTEEHPKFYNKVKVDYHFTGSHLEEEKINKAVDLSVKKYCGVMEMFRKFSKVKTEIFLHQK